jgi:diguanylate cyclase (GGDEF)-like protein
MLVRILNAFGAATCCAAAGIVVTGHADAFLIALPSCGAVCALCVVLSCAAALVTARMGRPVFIFLGPLCALCLLSIIAVRFSGGPVPGSAYGSSAEFGASPLYLCYYAVILLFAASSMRLWFVAPTLFCFAEIASLYFSGYFKGFLVFPSAGWESLLLSRAALCAQPLGLMVLSALLPFVTLRFARFQGVAPAAGRGPQATSKISSVNSAPPTVLMQRDHMPVSSKTQMLLVEPDAGGLGASGVNELLASVVYFMSRNFKAYSALGFVFDPLRRAFVLNSFHSKNYTIVKGIEIPLGKGVVGRIGVDRKSFLSGDLSLYPEELLYYRTHESINSVLAVPILSDSRELLGALVIDNIDKHTFTEQHKETMLRFSSLAAALITNVRMRIFQERAAKSFQIFYEASQQFITALRTAQVFEVLFGMISQLTPATRMMLVTFNETTRCGVVTAIKDARSGTPAGASPDIAEGTEFPINAGLYSYAFQKRTIVNIGDFQLYKDKYYRFAENEPRNPSIASLVIFPIVDDEQRIIGLLSLEGDAPNQFFGDTEKHLSILIGNASVAITRARLYQKMETLATTDGLTQLFNHRTFQEHLAKEVERARRYRRPLSLLLMDIDHFKSFNDTYGHPVGDLVLKEISACIRSSIRVNDIAARYGGEEFTVIIPETGEEGAMVIAERIRRTVEQHVIVSLERQLRVTISLGCATMPSHADTGQALIDNADKALYYSKEHGRNATTLFAKGMAGEKK